MDFLHRSYQPELIDDPAMPFPEISKNLKELDLINTWLGGHAISIKGLKKIIQLASTATDKHWQICEIGCGGGDNLRALANWCAGNKINASFTGIDINRNCIEFAAGKEYQLPVRFIESDYRLIDFETNPDIIFNSLFCHHFKDEDIVEMLGWMYRHSEYGFFINDLHRHPVAFYLIKYITKIFSSSRLVKNDAPLSVRRGFKSREWKKIFENAAIPMARLTWEWAFRYLIVYCHALKDPHERFR
jgi:2-polyprenyl-3-methyl-5-hydroxy-6-metoxy-1,4-benzoquinol methylase